MSCAADNPFADPAAPVPQPDWKTKPGVVYLVGAGPGDPSLLTIRGLQCLQEADLVVYDDLVNPHLLQYAPPKAELVRFPLADHERPTGQQEINCRMIEVARAGKVVVRLKLGDPSVFGRTAQEADVLRAAGVAVEVVPGVTAALGAAAYADIPITHAAVAPAVALVAAQPGQGQARPLDFAPLAQFPGTLVVYMGVTSARQWTEQLIRAGKPAQTPAAIVQRCSWSDQVMIRCTLGSLADVIETEPMRAPAVIFVGEAVARTPDVSWFASRPLFGRRVLVTRPRHQADALSDQLTALGAEVLVQPAIQIDPPADWGPVDKVLAALDQFDWLVFSSANGVQYFVERLWQVSGDVRKLGTVRLAAIGPATAEQLARYRLRADVVPSVYQAEGLVEALAAEARGRRFLLARASRGRETLAEQLAARGASVTQVVVYQSTDVREPDAEVRAALVAGRIDWVTVTSSAIARWLVRMFGPHLRQSKLASISPVTSEVLRQLGYEPQAEARTATMSGLIQAILETH